MSGGSSGGTTTTIAEPSAEVKPYLAPYMEKAVGLSEKPYEEYTGMTVAPQNAYQQAAIGGIVNRAITGSPVQTAGSQVAYDTLTGQYLDPSSNPWLQRSYDMAANDMTRNYLNATVPGINSSFSLAGRYGSGQHQMALDNANTGLARELQNLGTNIYGGAYGQERSNMMSTMAQSPQLANAEYNDMQQLLGAGDVQQNYQQQVLTDLYSRWAQAQQYPYTQLDVIGNALKTTMGSGGKTSVYGPEANPAGQLAGLALAGAGLWG
jgi:hypothetical protein